MTDYKDLNQKEKKMYDFLDMCYHNSKLARTSFCKVLGILICKYKYNRKRK